MPPSLLDPTLVAPTNTHQLASIGQHCRHCSSLPPGGHCTAAALAGVAQSLVPKHQSITPTHLRAAALAACCLACCAALSRANPSAAVAADQPACSCCQRHTTTITSPLPLPTSVHVLCVLPPPPAPPAPPPALAACCSACASSRLLPIGSSRVCASSIIHDQAGCSTALCTAVHCYYCALASGAFSRVL